MAAGQYCQLFDGYVMNMKGALWAAWLGWVAETAALLDSMQGKQKLVIKCHSGSGG